MARKKTVTKVKPVKKSRGKGAKRDFEVFDRKELDRKLKAGMKDLGWDFSDEDEDLEGIDHNPEPEHWDGIIGVNEAYPVDTEDFNWKYGEGELLDQLREYIKTTYGQHYANMKTGTQVLDMYESIGIAIPSCQANAIKYLCRYGKKNGEERKDLLKSLHYTILLIHFIELKNREEEEYGTTYEA